MIRSPALLAAIATLSWGFWAFFTKLATRTGKPESVLIISYAVGSGVGLAYFLLTPGGFQLADRDLWFAIAAGLATGVGSILYYAALKAGDIGYITAITGLYFLVSVTLGIVFLGESLTIQKTVGIVLASVAILLLLN